MRPSSAEPEWLEQWALPCPDGNPQRLGELTAFRLKGPDLLQLRVVIHRPGDLGVCQLLVDEQLDRIFVRAIVCQKADELDLPVTEAIDCGFRHWLDAPLDERIVIDVDSGLELPLLIPHWGEDRPDELIPRPRGSLWPTIPGRCAR